jgi:hypothetical protein
MIMQVPPRGIAHYLFRRAAPHVQSRGRERLEMDGFREYRRLRNACISPPLLHQYRRCGKLSLRLLPGDPRKRPKGYHPAETAVVVATGFLRAQLARE